MFIDGIGIKGYRSFGGDVQYIGPFSKINLFIGKNNSGKSNIIKFLRDNYGNLVGSVRNSFFLDEKIDQPRGSVSDDVVISFPLCSDRNLYLQLKDECAKKNGKPDDLEKFLALYFFSDIHNVPWLSKYSSWNSKNQFEFKDLSKVVNFSGKTLAFLGNLCYSLTGNSFSSRDERLERLHKWMIEIVLNNISKPKISLIPAIRKIEAGVGNHSDLSGPGLIERLAVLQNPEFDELEQREKFDQIIKFLQIVTGEANASIRIPDSKSQILVDINNKELPLESLGTGIHEVIILAAAATTCENQVLCIEEPELHLHPRLQKELLRYLKENTNNQYFITTHSAHLLDIDGVSIFHVQLEKGNSIVVPVNTNQEKFLICSDLGYKASDILQANCIIWVEGPSDRIYLNYWLQHMAEGLIEGLHYSIMFYGGRLLSHLTAEDTEITEFISLRSLNRNACILIDSDKDKLRKRLKPAPERVKKEFEKGSGFAWITKGREIENYIDPEILESAVKKAHPSATGLSNKGQYDNCLKEFITNAGVRGPADKLKVANAVIETPPNMDVLDLKDKMNKLIDFIHASNN